MKWFIFWLCLAVFAQAQPFRPEDANLGNQDVHYLTTDSLPQGQRNFCAFNIWFQSATLLRNQEDNSTIKVDWARILEYNLVTQTESQVIFEDYNILSARSLSTNEGGLYVRYPSWFASDSSRVMDNSWVNEGILTVKVGERPSQISHWWLPRLQAKAQCVYYCEMSVAISGNLGLQIGCDWWKNLSATFAGLNVNNTESWHSDWYGSTYGEFINIRTPLLFDARNYGVTTTGTFFLSAVMAQAALTDTVWYLGNQSNWQPIKMSLENGFYVYPTGWPVVLPETYCFKVGNRWLPEYIKRCILEPENIVPNGQGGTNFRTLPVSQIRPIDNSVLIRLNELKISPNPINAQATVSFELRLPAQTKLELVNIMGQVVRLIINQRLGAGKYQCNLDTNGLPSGKYYLFVTSGKSQLVKPLVIVR